MRRFKKPLLGLLAACLLFTGAASAESSKDDVSFRIPEIQYQKFVLDNGLTLIVHEDHKAPIVAVNVWYHVGSKNEKPGKTGFAHLFEHLMFNGSEHFNDDYFQALERVGATDLNGTTNRDRTNYFQNVPTSALDLVLWLESDRMGHLLGAIDQAKLDEQRGVVQNEKRQGENRPYGRVFNIIAENTFPKGHPYSWTTIGSMEDLNAASLEDVREWFKTYYGAANAVLVVAGDVDAETVKAKVEKYFGDIPSGPPVAKHDAWIAKRTGEHRMVMQDRVPQARVYKVWNVPEWGNRELVYLDLASDILSSGKTSRLYKRLVYDEQIATDVAAYVYTGEIASQFLIQATARPGVDLKQVEKALDEELARFLDDGPTEKELRRVKAQYFSNFVRGIERIGGFGGKSDILAMNQVYGGSPDYYKSTLQYVKDASPADVHAAAREWLSDGVFVLEVHPFPKYKTLKTDVDRSKLPEPGPPPAAKFPRLQKATLSNGLKIILAERHTVPVVNFNLLVDAGYAADQFAVPGTASLTMNMLDEGTKKRTALQISEELAMLGARLSTGSNLDISSVSLSALKANLDASLDIFADVILNPSFPEADFNRLKKQQLAAIQREKSNPVQMALRVFPKLLYGENHAYGNPFTGSGTEASVSKLTRDDLKKFHRTWFKPNNATLVVVGDITLKELKGKLETYFKNWKPGDVPKKNIGRVEHKTSQVVYLMDKPGAIQSIIFAAHIALPKANPEEIAIETLNNILGGTFTARINMNLREDKHWSYGARSLLIDARGQRPFLVYAPVQSDKTRESMQEIARELNDILSTRPPTQDELDKIKKNRILRLPGTWETMSAVAGSIVQMERFGLPDDYWDRYPDMIRSLNLQQIKKAARTLLHPDKIVWLVVGDREKIEDGIRELGFGPIYFVDADGNLIQ
ncbi:MAG: pitrilysin family protein [candidate division KSB1 bacterium]|nr:pitrilysin family protein [candidate division KSB1 bacterium]